MSHTADQNIRPETDDLIVTLADYALNHEITSDEAYDTARYCLMDSLACGCLALDFPACTNQLGPIVPGTIVPDGVRVPGTSHVLDPVKAAFDIGALIRWLDFNDTWLAAEWGHPSDNLGGILAAADYLGQRGRAITMRDVLTSMIKAHEIQGVLALNNSFNQVGLDHVILVKVATTAVISKLFGLTRDQTLAALSHAWVDGQSLRTYRHAPNAGSRKSWAAGDATSRAVRLVMMVQSGQAGLPAPLTAKRWGFEDVLFKGESVTLAQPLDSYVMEHVLFKISFPAEFHAQTAVECAVQLHGRVRHRINEIERIEVTTQEPAIRIISKDGPLHNPADRDHCLQYMIAVPMLTGDLIADYYEDDFAADPRIDELRAKMRVTEDPQFTQDYYDPSKRAISNAIQVFFKDGSSTDRICVEYPIGHRRRRSEGIPVLLQKWEHAVCSHFSRDRFDALNTLCLNTDELHATPVDQLMGMLVKGS